MVISNQVLDGQGFKVNIMYQPNLEEVIANLVKETLNESQVRDIVGAPSIEESESCACGDKLEECKDSYEHMTHGV